MLRSTLSDSRLRIIILDVLLLLAFAAFSSSVLYR